MRGTAPRWLNRLERPLGWISIPQIAILLVTLQGLGFLLTMMDPVWVLRLALIPQQVAAGEYWRLVTFLALPVASSPLWLIFALWFLYFVVNTIESEWGAFRTTFYVLVSVLLTIACSFLLGFPVLEVTDFHTSLFLAAAALYPEMEIRLYLAIPVKLKWLGWLSLAFVAWRFVGAGWNGRIYLLAIYSNYLLFFGPAVLADVKNFARRQAFKRKMR